MDYDFSGLSSRSFEQMVQALAVGVLGPGLTIFGDGPDGGREATIEGPVAYPTSNHGWDGYIVVQAKFRARPASRERDAKWLIEELRREVQSYKLRTRRRPDYLILATNVTLTPVEGSGSKDRVHQALGRASRELSLRGTAVWDYDQLRSFLDNNEHVRTKFLAAITPGDVLQRIIERLDHAIEDGAPSFDDAMVSLIQKELISDQYVNLEQAGHAVEDKIPLGQVFVDLPIVFDQVGPGRAGARSLDDAARFVDVMIDAGEQVLAPDLIATSRTDGSLMPMSRVVLVGGPGQGKTTLGQFLCQMHRVALLRRRDGLPLPPEVCQAMTSVSTCVAKDELRMPAFPRFPVRVILNSFASALARPGGPASLLEYITGYIAKRAGATVSPSTFKQWLAAYPWLLVLDGLDEVPSSSNRDEVLASIADFWVDAAIARSDVLVLATTRPQGYGADFSPESYQHMQLSVLDSTDALRYGERLAHVRYGRDDTRYEKVAGRLRRAANNDATRRLMQTPLQVTIMTALVDRMGQPPQDRWSLFHAYYEVIYQREMERDIPAATILREFQPDVDAIHRRVALLLQVKSEQAQQTDARLSPAQLAEVIEQRLIEEGHRGEDLEALKDAILTAASERLVFLVGLEHGSVGFEIRSLQEFMAAECLMDGEDTHVRDRLTAVAGVSSWRNVVLFAVGYCFARRQALRDMVFTLCAMLNSDASDLLARRRMTGSLLAVDLLLDGSVQKQPRYRDMLAHEAVRAFRLVPGANYERVVEAYDETVEPIYRVQLEESVEGSNVSACLGAWDCLLALDSRGVEWASALRERAWPQTSEGTGALIWGLDGAEFSTATKEHLLRAVVCQPVERVISHGDKLRALASGAPEAASVRSMTRSGPEIRVPVGGSRPSDGLTMSLVPLAHARGTRALVPISGLDTSWKPLIAGDAFSRRPSGMALARLLREICAEVEPAEWVRSIHLMPWPLAACLSACRTRDELLEVASAAAGGELADVNAWEAAERRWRGQEDVAPDMFHLMEQVTLPFDQRIGREGVPFIEGTWHLSHATATRSHGVLRDLYGVAITPGKRAAVAGVLAWATCVAARTPEPFPGEAPTVQEFAGWLSEAVVRPWVDLAGISRLGLRGSRRSIARALDLVGTDTRISLNGVRRDVARGFGESLAGLVADFPWDGLWTLTTALVSETPVRERRRVLEKVEACSRPRSTLGRVARAITLLHDPRRQHDVEELVGDVIAAARKDHDAALWYLAAGDEALREHRRRDWILGTLDEGLPREAVAMRRRIAEMSDDALRRRPSPLRKRQVWRSLALFERDESMIKAR